MSDIPNIRITQEQYQAYSLEEKIKHSLNVIQYFKDQRQTLLIKELLKSSEEELERLNNLKQMEV